MTSSTYFKPPKSHHMKKFLSKNVWYLVALVIFSAPAGAFLYCMHPAALIAMAVFYAYMIGILASIDDAK